MFLFRLALHVFRFSVAIFLRTSLEGASRLDRAWRDKFKVMFLFLQATEEFVSIMRGGSTVLTS